MDKQRQLGPWPLLWGAIAFSACTAQLGGAEGEGASEGGSGTGAGQGPSDGASPTEGDGSGAIGEEGRLVVGHALRRLSIREIENTLDSYFPEVAAERVRFPLEGYEIFDNDEAHTDNGLAFVENVALVMKDVVERAREVPSLWSRIEACAPTDDSATCLGLVYDAWAPLVLRRESDAEERARFVALSSVGLGARSDAVAVAFEALLRHPEFVHRVEQGTGQGEVRSLSQREILGRLSFLLWGQAPDAALLGQAAALDLSDDSVRRDLAQSMLGDERARETIAEYHAQWIGYSTMDTQGIGQDMWDESRQLVERVVFEEGANYDQLFVAADSFVTPQLAEHYGLTAPAAPSWVSVAGTGRAGILGHGSFLSSFANVGDTSPTKRGKNVQNRLLCRDIQLPESSMVDVDAQPEPGQCYQEFLSEVHSVGSCGTCHQLLDGVGFGLDAFDRLGVFRTHETDKEHCAVEGLGDLDGQPFEGPAGLGQLLVDHQDFVPCVAQQLVHYYAGFDARTDQQASNWSGALAQVFEDSNRDFRSLLLSLVASPEFAFVAPR